MTPEEIDAQRAETVRVARTFIGTRYRHNAKIKGVGVDCGTFLAMVFSEAKIIPPYDVGKYSHQFHMHHEAPLYENAVLLGGGHQIDAPSGVGDIVLYFQGKQFAHGAIITQIEPRRIIHAFAPSRCVVEGAETEFGVIADADKKFFSTW